jgi:hypothetical protein
MRTCRRPGVKTETLFMRIQPDAKAEAVRQAMRRGLSLSEHVERLILSAAASPARQQHAEEVQAA